jgi:hypothetical protein
MESVGCALRSDLLAVVLLSQKEPLPEKYLLGAPEAVFHNPFGQGSFGPEILEQYVSTYRSVRARAAPIAAKCPAGLRLSHRKCRADHPPPIDAASGIRSSSTLTAQSPFGANVSA